MNPLLFLSFLGRMVVNIVLLYIYFWSYILQGVHLYTLSVLRTRFPNNLEYEDFGKK
jgi:hypothetical protein